ncbi:MAG: histone deacetylase family protein [Pseudomonadales bacterium]|jgi:acetoin utilization deacetylase AcuC-like enzyme|nr:histone deacetylase family protein [Pseudomonadales bacterium]
MILIYSHDSCLQHDPGPKHPENPGRLHSIIDALQAPALRPQLRWLQAPRGSEAQVLLAHTQEHLDVVLDLDSNVLDGSRRALDPDTILSDSTLDAALRAVGAACEGVNDLVSGLATEVFCLTRPPGHHATPTRAMGFCVFNPVAIAAFQAQRKGVQRVAVVDFDVHHGNGTQDCLSGKNGLLYVSTHQSPHYPGTGLAHENRPGNIFNLPLPAGTTDASYRARFTAEVLPVLDAFRPQLLLVSAGFDAHRDDPLGGLCLDESTYAWLGATLRAIAQQHCQGRLLSVLEGGYNLSALGPSVAAYLSGQAPAR